MAQHLRAIIVTLGFQIVPDRLNFFKPHRLLWLGMLVMLLMMLDAWRGKIKNALSLAKEVSSPDGLPHRYSVGSRSVAGWLVGHPIRAVVRQVVHAIRLSDLVLLMMLLLQVLLKSLSLPLPLLFQLPQRDWRNYHLNSIGSGGKFFGYCLRHPRGDLMHPHPVWIVRRVLADPLVVRRLS